MSYILLVEIWYFLSIFICRKRNNCKKQYCPVRSYCSKSSFTDEELHEINLLLSTLEDDKPDH